MNHKTHNVGRLRIIPLVLVTLSAGLCLILPSIAYGVPECGALSNDHFRFEWIATSHFNTGGSVDNMEIYAVELLTYTPCDNYAVDLACISEPYLDASGALTCDTAKSATFILNGKELSRCTNGADYKILSRCLCRYQPIPCQNGDLSPLCASGDFDVESCDYAVPITSDNYLKAGNNTLSFSTSFFLGVTLTSTFIRTTNMNHEIVLKGPENLSKPIYSARWLSAPQSVSITFTLTWDEYNPGLSKYINDILANIDSQKASLLEDAAESQIASVKKQELDALTPELEKLIDEKGSNLTKADVDNLIGQNYPDIIELQSALDELLSGLTITLSNLYQQFYDALVDFTTTVNSIVSSAIKAATDYGFNPYSWSNYQETVDVTAFPYVIVPPISAPDTTPFDPNNDQYAQYADKILAALKAKTSGGIVTDRSGFLSIVKGWKDYYQYNSIALQSAAVSGYVSLPETTAFLNAQKRITDYLGTYIDENMWYRDCGVAPDIKKIIDNWGYGINPDDRQPWPFLQYGKRLKEEFETWYGTLSDAQLFFLSLLPATEDYVQSIAYMMKSDDSTDPDYIGTYNEANVVLKELDLLATRVTIDATPHGSEVINYCEAVKGRELCKPDGRILSTDERVVAGKKAVLGTITFWARLYELADDTSKLIFGVIKALTRDYDYVEVRLPSLVSVVTTVPGFSTLSNQASLSWYKSNLATIGTYINKNLTLEQQAMEAWMLRNNIKKAAYYSMYDRNKVSDLSTLFPQVDFWSLINDEVRNKGSHLDDALYKKIIDNSMKSDPLEDLAWVE